MSIGFNRVTRHIRKISSSLKFLRVKKKFKPPICRNLLSERKSDTTPPKGGGLDPCRRVSQTHSTLSRRHKLLVDSEPNGSEYILSTNMYSTPVWLGVRVIYTLSIQSQTGLSTYWVPIMYSKPVWCWVNRVLTDLTQSQTGLKRSDPFDSESNFKSWASFLLLP